MNDSEQTNLSALLYGSYYASFDDVFDKIDDEYVRNFADFANCQIEDLSEAIRWFATSELTVHDFMLPDLPWTENQYQLYFDKVADVISKTSDRSD